MGIFRKKDSLAYYHNTMSVFTTLQEIQVPSHSNERLAHKKNFFDLHTQDSECLFTYFILTKQEEFPLLDFETVIREAGNLRAQFF